MTRSTASRDRAAARSDDVDERIYRADFVEVNVLDLDSVHVRLGSRANASKTSRASATHLGSSELRLSNDALIAG